MKPSNKKWITCLAMCMLVFNVMAQTAEIKGLTVVVEFADAPFTNSLDSVSMMMNQPGFSGWGNIGSVRDYFYDQTDGKILITSTVIKVSLPYNVSTYYGDFATRKDISDVCDRIEIDYPDGFTNLTIDEDGTLKHFNIVCKADKGAWAFGQQEGNTMIQNNGQDLQVRRGNITAYGRTQDPQHSTVCHEIGHSLFGWADYYNASENDGSSNMGHYCVMGSGGTDFNPSPICAPLRYKKGWINTVTEIPNTTTNYTIISNSRSKVFKYTNPANTHEYFLIEALYTNGYYAAFDGEDYSFDQGLAVWYVDEEKGKYNPATLPHNPTIKLLQADGLDEMHDLTKNAGIFEQKRDLRGDMNDLFDSQYHTLSASTHSLFRWKDGSEPGLTITNISAAGASMQFTVQARPNTITSQSVYSNGGTVSPSGLISYTNGTNKIFSIVPEIGYQVSDVVVDNVSKGPITSHTVSTSGNHIISATFQTSTTADPLPAPWLEAQIGNTRKAGTAGYRGGIFGLESSSYDIWHIEDGLGFIYQPMSGNGEIIGRINSMNKPGEWAKAGIMMRESLAANSKHFMLVKTPSNNLAPQMRVATGGESFHNPQGTDIKGEYNKYVWFKIVRLGNVFTSYCSLTGTGNWIQLATYTIPMNSTIFVGMCAGAGSDAIGTKVTFSNVTVSSSNIAPTVSIELPVNNASFTAPASISIHANAADANGSVSKVEFYNGSTLLATDNSSPYSYTWSNVSAGAYTLTAKATDNLGAVTTSAAVNITVVNSTANISGPACGSNNSTLLYELSASKRSNATGYNWYFTGSSQSITPMSGAAYKANLATGSNFQAGQVCVGVNYSVSPWYASYCVSVSNCSSPRKGEAEFDKNEYTVSGFQSFPNPFSMETVIAIPDGQSARIQVFNANGIMIEESTATSEYRFGNNLTSGIYFVTIDFEGKIETMKLIKE